MPKIKRVFLIVLDSVGIGELPDANEFGDVGSNTLKSCYDSGKLHIPNMESLGMFSIDGLEYGSTGIVPIGSYAKLSERSKGKDTTIGHWEIAGSISKEALPTYPNGFPKDVIVKFEKLVGRKVICNKPYSGTQIIEDYGDQHVSSGNLIVYTSADSVFQIAAHEDIVPVNELYDICEKARKMLHGKHGVGRVIARPFTGKSGNYMRTSNRHDFSLEPPKKNMCTVLEKSGLDVIGIGKIFDIFAGVGITDNRGINENNAHGMTKTLELQKDNFNGLAFVNLVDFDMVYGHRNNVEGYTRALNEFDIDLGDFIKGMRQDDILMITADHGCDPATPSTDHSREYIPLLIYGDTIIANVNLGVRQTFADIAATITDILNVPFKGDGQSFKGSIIK